MEEYKIKIGDTVQYKTFGQKIDAKVLGINTHPNCVSIDEKLLLDISHISYCRGKTWVKTKNVKLIKKS